MKLYEDYKMKKENVKFSTEVSKKLDNYVYRLIDPRNGETFYIGKGKGNRVFSHANAEPKEDSAYEKISRIRDINLAGFKVLHVIHRHGMDEKTAFEVEAALIDAYPGLTNSMSGHGNNEYGSMHAEEIIQRYSAEVADFQHRILLININRSALDNDLLDAVSYAWRLKKQKAESAEVILATFQGLIVGVFIAEKWLEATHDNFPGKTEVKDRYGFIGSEAPQDIKERYINKVIPDKYRKKGASNPIKYTW